MSLTISNTPIDDVKPHPQNVRQGDVGAISESLRAHGQYRPIVVQKSTGYILAGNHTWKAAKALGWTRIETTELDVDDDRALRILLVDNRANDLATYNDHALADLLRDLASTESHLKGTGYDGDDLDELLTTVLSEEDAFGALPDGDRSDITQMTFTMTLDQSETVKEALARCKHLNGFDLDTGNKNSNGNALAFIAQDFIRGLG